MASQAKTAEDLNDLMRLMMKSALERMLNTEMDVHLGRKGLAAAADPERSTVEPTTPAEPAEGKKRAPNRRNGRSRKAIQGDLGELDIATPRDRDGILPRDVHLRGGADDRLFLVPLLPAGEQRGPQTETRDVCAATA